MTSKAVSFVIAARNEERSLAAAVDSIFNQVGLSNIEVSLAIGPSRDKTLLVADQLSKRYPQLMVLENPSGGTSAGLNLAIAATSHDVVIRVDGHSVLPPDYGSLAVQVLAQTKAANVGGLMVAKGEGPIQSAIAYAYNSKVGLGGGAYHTGGNAGPVDSVYLGCFRREWLDRVGGFDEKWVRGQDWELNARIRSAGGTVWFDPRLQVSYTPRRNLSELALQFWRTGQWRGALTREAPRASRLRYWIPPLFVVATLAGFPLLAYAMFLAFAAAGATELSWRSRALLVPVLATIHYSWGLGFWIGLIKGV